MQPTAHRGILEQHIHDYVSHGTTTLLAALRSATGEVIAESHQPHPKRDFLQLLRSFVANGPAKLDFYRVMDNYGAHKRPTV